MTVKIGSLTPRARHLLGMIRRQGSITRATLIRDTGLSGTAVFRATEELEAAGLVRTGEPVAAGRGQPSALIHILPDAAFSLGLSIMTDRADVLLIDLAGAVRARREIATTGMPRDAILDAAARFATDALAGAGAASTRLVGIGVAVAGYYVDGDRLNPGEELEDWALLDLKSAVAARLGMAVEIENIAAAAALGEWLLGAGATFESFCYFNVAAGFGAGLFLNGQLWRGRHGNAGEIAGLFSLAGRATPNLASLRTCLAAHNVHCDSIADLTSRFDPAWPGVDTWLADHQPSFDYLFNSIRFMVDCEALILGGRIPRMLAQRIVDGASWPENHLPARRDQRAPATTLTVAALEPELAAPLGAASLLFHRHLFG